MGRRARQPPAGLGHRHTQSEARKALRTLQREVAENTTPGERTITVEGYWSRWRTGPLLSADRKASSVELYTSVMRVHILPALGNVRLSRLTAGQVETMLAGMTRHRDSRTGKAGEPVAGQTRRTAHTVLRLMLATAVRDGVVGRNVCDQVDRPRIDTPEADYLTATQLREVLAAMSGHRLEPLILLLATTGLRIGEGLALRWSDLVLDADPPRLRVTGTVRVVGGLTQRTPPKSLRGRRSLPLSPVVVVVLRAWHAVQSAERLRAGTAWHRSDYVFTTTSGRLLDQRNAARSYARALAVAGVELPARFHLLRHTAASIMLADGAVSVRTASEVLGHATTSITADVYGHVAQQAKMAALDVIAGALDAG